MQFSFTKACLALSAAVTVLAQTPGFDVFSSPEQGLSLTPGSTFKIKWTPSAPAGTVSIILLQGATQQTLQLGATVAAGIQSTQGSFDWTVPASTFALYGFKLELDSDNSVFQYSFPFTIAASPSVPTSTLPTNTKTIVVSQVSTLPTTSNFVTSTVAYNAYNVHKANTTTVTVFAPCTTTAVPYKNTTTTSWAPYPTGPSSGNTTTPLPSGTASPTQKFGSSAPRGMVIGSGLFVTLLAAVSALL